MKPSYSISPRARRDLAGNWKETTEKWGIQQAEAYLRQIQTSIELIARNPNLSRACDEIRPGYRKYTSGSHVLFMRMRNERLEVVRSLHGRMDFGRWL